MKFISPTSRETFNVSYSCFVKLFQHAALTVAAHNNLREIMFESYPIEGTLVARINQSALPESAGSKLDVPGSNYFRCDIMLAAATKKGKEGDVIATIKRSKFGPSGAKIRIADVTPLQLVQRKTPSSIAPVHPDPDYVNLSIACKMQKGALIELPDLSQSKLLIPPFVHGDLCISFKVD